jgi:hypothetical protein
LVPVVRGLHEGVVDVVLVAQQNRDHGLHCATREP